MRSLCREYARRALTDKRGGGTRRITFESGAVVLQRSGLDRVDLLAVDRALDRLAALDQEQARIVGLRFYSGCTDAEIATALGISEATVRRRWRSARAFLKRELAG